MSSSPPAREVLVLVRSTGETDVGPILEYKRGQVILRYDAESVTGVVWTELMFDGSIAVRTTPDPACTVLMIEAYSRVCEVEESEWLKELRSAAESSGDTLPLSARHFFVYFDHVGCVEVLAESVKVTESDASVREQS